MLLVVVYQATTVTVATARRSTHLGHGWNQRLAIFGLLTAFLASTTVFLVSAPSLLVSGSAFLISVEDFLAPRPALAVQAGIVVGV
jgi:hypothetical protein